MSHEEKSAYNTGLSEELVRRISSSKGEPAWMLEKRLLGLALYLKTPMPKFGPSLEGLDLEHMNYYVDPGVAEANAWETLPTEISETFEKLGIPKAEREYLGGVGAQYDSGSVYHHLKK